jgi:YggT family protein
VLPEIARQNLAKADYLSEQNRTELNLRSQLTLFLDPLIGLYVLTFALRLGMQWVRVDYRNPIVQFVVKVTNPLVMPLQRLLPPIYKIDTATLVVYMLLCWATMLILLALECFLMPDLLRTFVLGLIYGARLLLNTYTFLLFGYVILSWVMQGGHNPSLTMISQLLSSLARPLLSPVQRIIPPIAGLDLSPIFVLIALQALARMAVGPAYRLALDFNCNIGVII